MKKSFYIDYPQEHLEDQAHSYRCAYCKVGTTVINGSLEGHLPSCEYRIKLEQAGFEVNQSSAQVVSTACDDVD